MIRTTQPRRGAVAAELALLALFVYLPLIVGGIYIGSLAAARQRVHESNHYALWTPGEQSSGEVGNEFFHEFTGRVGELVDRDDRDADVPSPGELRRLFEEFTRPIYHRNVSAHGSFYLDGNVVRYREDVQIDEGFRVRPEGQLVTDWRLLEDNIPENVSELLSDYLRRREARTTYVHSWVHDESDLVAGRAPNRAWNLQVPNPAFRDQWTPECAVRWTKTRMARDQSPPGAQQRQEVGCPLQFAGYEPAEDFYHPNELQTGK